MSMDITPNELQQRYLDLYPQSQLIEITAEPGRGKTTAAALLVEKHLASSPNALAVVICQFNQRQPFLGLQTANRKRLFFVDPHGAPESVMGFTGPLMVVLEEGFQASPRMMRALHAYREQCWFVRQTTRLAKRNVHG